MVQDCHFVCKVHQSIVHLEEYLPVGLENLLRRGIPVHLQNHQVASRKNQKYRNQGTSCSSKTGNCHPRRGAITKGRLKQTQNLNHLKSNACDMSERPHIHNGIGIMIFLTIPNGVPCATLCWAAWPGSTLLCRKCDQGQITHGREESFFQFGSTCEFYFSKRRGVVDLRRSNMKKTNGHSCPFLSSDMAE